MLYALASEVTSSTISKCSILSTTTTIDQLKVSDLSECLEARSEEEKNIKMLKHENKFSHGTRYHQHRHRRL